MRPDQLERLRDLEERLADVVLEEADPDTWPGAGKPLASLTQQERGDRFWCKRNAAATFGLLERTVRTLADAVAPHGGRDESHDDELGNEIERMEREGVVGPPNGVKPRQVLIRPAGEMNPVPNL